MKVKLINYTENPLLKIFIACKICRGESGIELYNSSAIHESKYKDMINLVRKVIEKGHLSVVEHIAFSFVIEGISRSCSHQLVRHRPASYSQQSQRYFSIAKKMESGEIEKRLEEFFVVPLSIKADICAYNHFKFAIQVAFENYKMLIEKNIPMEDARFLLPNAAKTSIMVTMNARELRHFCELRCAKEAQWEIRELAKQMLREAYNVIPIVFEDLKEKYLPIDQRINK